MVRAKANLEARMKRAKSVTKQVKLSSLLVKVNAKLAAAEKRQRKTAEETATKEMKKDVDQANAKSEGKVSNAEAVKAADKIVKALDGQAPQQANTAKLAKMEKDARSEAKVEAKIAAKEKKVAASPSSSNFAEREKKV